MFQNIFKLINQIIISPHILKFFPIYPQNLPNFCEVYWEFVIAISRFCNKFLVEERRKSSRLL